MRDHQTPGGQSVNINRARGLSPAVVTECVTLLSVASLLCLCDFTTASLAESGGGQQVASQDYEKMSQESFSGEQWLKLLRQRVHQPIAIWHGIGTGEIAASSTGMSFRGLQFEESRSQVLERQLSLNGLMARQPLLTLPFFEDPDPEIVVIGIGVYVIAYDKGELRPKEMDKAVADRIAEAIRQKLLTHRDARIRWAAVQMLGQTRWMTLQDIEKGLNDPTDAIRVTTAFWLDMVRGAWSWESDPDNTDEPNSPTRLTREQFRQRDARLAQIVLEHLNDTHFFVRDKAGEAVHTAFLQRVSDLQNANPTKKPVALPRDFDWVRSEWARRAATQKAWKRWWTDNGVDKTPPPKK